MENAAVDREQPEGVVLIHVPKAATEGPILDMDPGVLELAAEEERVVASLGGPGLANVESTLDWILEQMGRAEVEAGRVRDVAERRRGMVTAWETDELHKIQRAQAHLLARARAHMPSTPEAFRKAWNTKKQSLSLPHGTLGFQTIASHDKVEILDQEKAAAWAEENGVEVKVKREVQITPVKTYVATTGDAPDPERDGIRFTPKGPAGTRFYCEPVRPVVE